jgi:hypothetical protein
MGSYNARKGNDPTEQTVGPHGQRGMKKIENPLVLSLLGSNELQINSSSMKQFTCSHQYQEAIN